MKSEGTLGTRLGKGTKGTEITLLFQPKWFFFNIKKVRGLFSILTEALMRVKEEHEDQSHIQL